MTTSLVVRLGADQLVLEARDQAARAELDRHALALAALERLTVDLALEVDDDAVADRRLVRRRGGIVALLAGGDTARPARRPSQRRPRR